MLFSPGTYLDPLRKLLIRLSIIFLISIVNNLKSETCLKAAVGVAGVKKTSQELREQPVFLTVKKPVKKKKSAVHCPAIAS